VLALDALFRECRTFGGCSLVLRGDRQIGGRVFRSGRIVLLRTLSDPSGDGLGRGTRLRGLAGLSFTFGTPTSVRTASPLGEVAGARLLWWLSGYFWGLLQGEQDG